MKLKKDIKIGAFAGITGFFLIFVFWYLTTGYFDWRFAAVIGTGCFGGRFLGSMLRRLYKTSEERKATMIVLIVISFLIISHIPSLIGTCLDEMEMRQKTTRFHEINTRR
jgi:uncharacterized membrane protein YfcA